MDERHNAENADGCPTPAESWRSAVGGDLLTRGEVEKLTGVTKRALEHYENKGLLRPRRAGEGVANNRRLYGEEDIERLKRIVVMSEFGLKLERIGQVLDEGDDVLVSVLEEQIDDLRRQENRLRNLILFAKFVGIAGTDVFEGLAAGPEQIDEFADMVRGSASYRAALSLMRRVDDYGCEAMFEELGSIVDDFVAIDEVEGFHGVERQVERFRAWWDDNVCPMERVGYLGFWAVFEDDVLLPSIVEAAGGELASGSLQMALFYVSMKRLMVEQGGRIEGVADALDDDVVLAMELASGLARAISEEMGVPSGAGDERGADGAIRGAGAAGERGADDEPGGADEAEVAELCVSVLSYMEAILQDAELMSYIDYRGEISLRAEAAAKARRAFELLAGGDGGPGAGAVGDATAVASCGAGGEEAPG